MFFSKIKLTVEQEEKLYEISEPYCGSEPVTDSWLSDIAHEQQAIAAVLEISLLDAKQAMIDFLGFSIDDEGFIE